MPLFEVPKSPLTKTLLRDDFIVPPFSILDAKSGYWLNRKHEWEKILNDRNDNIRNDTAKGNTAYLNSFKDEKWYGLNHDDKISTFDPFLAEILIKWFSKKGMHILDPFAGGIVRGAVSGICGRKYTGIDISPYQTYHNIKRWNELLYEHNDITEKDIVWAWGDSETIDFKNTFDMMLTCPPYYDLEHYTDNPQDLSNLPNYNEFLHKYTTIIQKCYDALKEDSFAVIVVAEIRDENGIIRGFVPDTINAFKTAGFLYYNEMILENRVVSLKVRCPKYFNQSRKVGRHHQNVLIFYKGNTKNIEDKFGKFKEGD